MNFSFHNTICLLNLHKSFDSENFQEFGYEEEEEERESKFDRKERKERKEHKIKKVFYQSDDSTDYTSEEEEMKIRRFEKRQINGRSNRNEDYRRNQKVKRVLIDLGIANERKYF